MNKNIPIVVCTVGSPCLRVLRTSVEVYAPDNELIVYEDIGTSFGEAYNNILENVFQNHDEVIIANDDIVLNPYSVERLLSDVQKLKDSDENIKIGFVGCMHDSARPDQNVRYRFSSTDTISFGRWTSEDLIKLAPVVAPIFAYFSKEAFNVARFPPIDWYSDDIICEDLNRKGFKHFISSSYVHHIGSYTLGKNYNACREKALPWIQENRPEYMDLLNKRLSFGKK